MGGYSGGWFKWRDLMGMLNGSIRHDLRPAKNFQRQTYYGTDHVGIYMLQAMIPGNFREKTRFQVAIEVDSLTGEWLRPAAGRAASGQSDWGLLNPSRIAGAATGDLLKTLPGLFNLTSLSNITSIIKYGLKPVYMLSNV